MRTQHYKLPISPEQVQKAMPGQWIMGEDDEIIGFIDFVSDAHVGIMLFFPVEFHPNSPPIHIAETCDWQTRLGEIMRDDPQMEQFWRECIDWGDTAPVTIN